jgi:hypothetical protein
MLFSTCRENNISDTNISILIGSYYRNKLSLIKINDKKIIEEKIILELTGGSRIIRAGFLSSEQFYVVFETDWHEYTKNLNKIRIYNLTTLTWEDVFDYYTTSNIRIVDVENAGVFFSDYWKRNILFYLDIINQTNNEIFQFSGDEEIMHINCRSNDSIILVNTFNKNENIYRYYFIDKITNEKIKEGIGQLFASKYSNYILYNNTNVYIIDDLINPILNKEISVGNNRIFSKATSIDNNSFILTFYSTTPMLWANFLFGGNHKREHYDYWIVTSNNNESDIEYFRISEKYNNFSNKEFFDAIILDDYGFNDY